MSSPAGRIEAIALGKKYRRGRQHDSLRDLIPAVARRLFSSRAESGRLRPEEFWALRDVSFDVGPGDSLGVIGHNGAGKSTLLRLLMRVTRPTTGRCRITGRLSGLLEIAAGFHPDLTGRENIWLQAAILGMSRADIQRRFTAIVDFSGIAEFIDTPVKRYSSGMMARLGFSIAAHVDPDALIIDEILAVGDQQFQAQAFGRIRELVTSGRPVILVSHQLPAVEELCRRAILLEHGTIVHEGAAAECVKHYLGTAGTTSRQLAEDSPVTIDAVEAVDADLVRSGDRLKLRITASVGGPIDDHLEPIAVILRMTAGGTILAVVGSREAGLSLPTGGPVSLAVSLQLNVAPGIYSIEVVAWDKKREVALASGPPVSVQVQSGQQFLGLVQTHPEMRILSK
ncbi:MAG: ATP-binding cassette domain-containing protein [Gemmatimonadetes bacterium]|nr:ATP-binding cassette domain-containing protein [Gemmatimonadota bacterium]